MSRRNKNGPKLELRLNVSPPPSQARQMSLVRSPSRSNTTSPSSCVSSETNQEEIDTTTSMVLVGCPRCLMYVMLSDNDPKCPKCKSTVLLDFLQENASAASTRRKKSWWN
ncbi:Protein GL2-INTERACTING REPRESSOR 2 [Cardamine amara subsp. amara]|uniref:Protein GL2-INTERACTING REPRESSOR 2 n=1 Tax=Cardamine amara subsp. amara TaxID=228776 RepID=A0ABD1AD14_CARAN